MEMLVPAPYEAPEKKAAGTRKGRQSKVISDSSPITPKRTPPTKTRRRKRKVPPPTGGDNKRKAAPIGESEGSKKGRTLLPDCSTTAAYSDDEWLPRDKPLAKS